MGKKPVLLIGIILWATMQNAFAANILPQFKAKKSEHTVPMAVQTPLDTRKTEKGALFEVLTLEPVVMDQQNLPANTLLSGHIVEIKNSRRLGRAAYVKVQFDNYTPPEHSPIELPQDASTVVTFQETKDASLVHAVKRGMILQHTSLLVSIPAAVAFSLSAPTIVVVDSAVDMMVGAHYGYTHKAPNDKHSRPQRVAIGVFRAMSSIPIYSDLMHKPPDMVYASSQHIAYPLPPAFLKTVSATLPNLDTPYALNSASSYPVLLPSVPGQREVILDTSARIVPSMVSTDFKTRYTLPVTFSNP